MNIMSNYINLNNVVNLYNSLFDNPCYKHRYYRTHSDSVRKLQCMPMEL